jgi:hypothetical protein
MYPLILCVVCLGLFLQPLSLAQSTNSPSEAVSSTELPFRLSSGYLIQVEGRIGAQTLSSFWTLARRSAFWTERLSTNSTRTSPRGES